MQQHLWKYYNYPGSINSSVKINVSLKTRFSDITDTAEERRQQNLASMSKWSKLKAIKKKGGKGEPNRFQD